jgi:hypothetical protein
MAQARLAHSARLPRKRKISNGAAFDAGREPRQGCGPDRLPARPCRSTACPPPMPWPRSSELLSAFDRSPKPASGRVKGSSPFDGSLRPDESPDAGAARPAPGVPPAAGPPPPRQGGSSRLRRFRPAAGASTAIGRLPSTAIGGPWQLSPQLHRALTACPREPIERVPTEVCCKADGLRFVLDVT